ncbi:MAG: alpha/beta fold hydrolase [Caulobacterales bacterium]
MRMTRPVAPIRFETRSGLRLAADLAGPDDGPLVVFAHGGGQTRASWRRPFAEIAMRGYRAVSLDARGHGESDWAPDGDYGLEALAGDLADVLDALAAPAVLVGASLGGLSSLTLAGSNRAAQVRGLVLVDVTPRLNPEGVERITAFMRANPNGFASLDAVADAVAVYNPHRPRPQDPSGLRRNLRERDGRFYWHWDPAFLTSTHRPDPGPAEAALYAAARRVIVPTLLVRGRESDLVRPEEAMHFQALMPHADYVDVAGAGHMVAGDDNDAFASAVFAFLERLAE